MGVSSMNLIILSVFALLLPSYAEIQDGTGMVVRVVTADGTKAIVETCDGDRVSVPVEMLKPTSLDCSSEPHYGTRRTIQ
jgi:hypothetical protein